MQKKLRVFLCHASEDKPIVRGLYQRLKSEGWVDPWLDEENLLGGHDFDIEINKATRDADAIIICLSKISVSKEGYVNKEIRRALTIAEEKLEGSIYVIPLRLDNCDPSFEQLKKLHWVNYFEDNGYEKLKKSLVQRFESLGEKVPPNTAIPDDLYKFVYFPSGEESHEFWISKYPVTNIQYERFLKDPYFDPQVALTYKSKGMFDNRDYWKGHPMFEKNRAERKITDNVVGAGYRYITERLAEPRFWYDPKGKEYYVFPGHEPKGGRIYYPTHWGDADFGIARKNVPVVGVSWYEASAYCRWLQINHLHLEEYEFNNNVAWGQVWVRLPTRKEWETAAGGRIPNGRYPWDRPDEITRDIREIFDRANVANHIGKTTPVDKYPKGASPRGVMDMGGNVWEWLANIFMTGDSLAGIAGGVQEDEIPSYGTMQLIGGSWKKSEKDASLCEAFYGHRDDFPDEDGKDIGFRVVLVKTL